METKKCLVLQKYRYMFKSYYVVWKPRWECIGGSVRWGLNRTMQYGNCHLTIPNHPSMLFKSYYVVWKPYLVPRPIGFSPSFKSYYVVWKRCGCNSHTRTKSRFKSYYVVWKPFHCRSFSFFSSGFKSYYVVWKPTSLAEQSRGIYFV